MVFGHHILPLAFWDVFIVIYCSSPSLTTGIRCNPKLQPMKYFIHGFHNYSTINRSSWEIPFIHLAVEPAGATSHIRLIVHLTRNKSRYNIRWRHNPIRFPERCLAQSVADLQRIRQLPYFGSSISFPPYYNSRQHLAGCPGVCRAHLRPLRSLCPPDGLRRWGCLHYRRLSY